jgi:hypothetical protein
MEAWREVGRVPGTLAVLGRYGLGIALALLVCAVEPDTTQSAHPAVDILLVSPFTIIENENAQISLIQTILDDACDSSHHIQALGSQTEKPLGRDDSSPM